MVDDTPYLAQLGDAQTAVVRGLFESLPNNGWDHCTVDFRSTSVRAETQAKLVSVDGSTKIIETSTAMRRALRSLRQLMGSSEGRAWLSVKIEAKPDGKVSFDYNYDNRPNWTQEPTDEDLLHDLDRNPRPADQIPDWYPRPRPSQ